jgi:hypothetical protein
LFQIPIAVRLVIRRRIARMPGLIRSAKDGELYCPRQEEQSMKILTILIILALFATIVSMVIGIGSMGRGGAYDDKHSGQFMNARVIFQAIAAILLLIALYAG